MEIPLTQGKIALIDDEDWPLVAGFKWHARVKRDRRCAYAVSCRDGRRIHMHRVILDAPPCAEVDHVNGDGLDNRRKNLRLATRSENQWNKVLYKTNTSGYKGVFWDKNCSRFRAAIKVFGVRRYLGSFLTAADAARAYDAAARDLHGEFAGLNFP